LLCGVAELRHFAPGACLYRSGDKPDGVFGLVEGALDILIPRIDGQEFVIHRADNGFWIGDLALFSNQERLVSARSAAPSLVVHLPAPTLGALLRDHPGLIADFYELTWENMATTLRLLGNLAVSGANQRVGLRLLVQQAQLPAGEAWISISQDTLAELVALSTQSVRRALRRLESMQFIECGYRRIRIIDAKALGEFCGYSLVEKAGRR